VESFLEITRALSDENRVRALLALDRGELCVCQIIDLLALAPSTVSKHMSILKRAGLVHGQKRGRWMYYRQAESSGPGPVREAVAWLRRALNGSPVVAADAKRLERIRQTDREAICRKIRRRG
jgi:DNA-binding transcriptional ArsR family regulator